jgi:hypothetical protein
VSEDRHCSYELKKTVAASAESDDPPSTSRIAPPALPRRWSRSIKPKASSESSIEPNYPTIADPADLAEREESRLGESYRHPSAECAGVVRLTHETFASPNRLDRPIGEPHRDVPDAAVRVAGIALVNEQVVRR